MLNTSRIKDGQKIFEDKLKKVLSITKTFLTNRDNLLLLFILIICICLFKIAFFGIKINDYVDIEGEINTSTSIDGSIDTDTSVNGYIDID